MSSTVTKSTEEDWPWQLIERARSGDVQAAADLVGEPRILKMAEVISASLRRGGVYGDYKDRDDLRQEILIRLWKNITTFRGSSMKQFESWLWALGRNNFNDDLRRVRRERELVEKNGLEGDYESADDLHRRTAIRRWLDRLDDEERALIEMHAAGMSLDEMTAALPDGKSRATVHRQLKRTQKKLIEIVKGEKR